MFSFESTISAFCGFYLWLCLLHQRGWSFVLDGIRTVFLSQELALARTDHSLIAWNTRLTFGHRGHYVSYILSFQGGLCFENRMFHQFFFLFGEAINGNGVIVLLRCTTRTQHTSEKRLDTRFSDAAGRNLFRVGIRMWWLVSSCCLGGIDE